MSAVHHLFTFPDSPTARLFVERVVKDIEKQVIEPVAILIVDCNVHVLDGDHQTERLAQLAKSSSATKMQAVRIPYPSGGSIG